MTNIRGLFRLNKKTPIKIFSSYEEAERSCSTYSDPDIADVVVKKTRSLKGEYTQIFNDQITRNFFVAYFVLHARSKTLKVIDLGGAAGISYFQLTERLSANIKQWNVIETEVMCKAAGSLSNEILHFFSSCQQMDAVSPVKSHDMLWAQGSLNFLPDPLATLKYFMTEQIPFIYISRTFFSEGDSFIFKYEAPLEYHGPGQIQHVKQKLTSYPLTVLSLSALKSMTTNYGYKFSITFDEGYDVIDSKQFPVRGFLISRA
jgi:putative methyltransferase (TIGR04325 family)